MAPTVHPAVGGIEGWGFLVHEKGFPGAVVAYLAGLPVTQGAHVGEPFTVLPWERRFVRGAFARGVRSAALSIARGNGKTALAAGIASATLDGPLVVPRGETVIVASSFEQARIAFEHVAAFMGERIGDRKEWRCWDTAQQARLEHRQLGYRVRCLGSDPKRAHGLAPVLVLADEPAQWPSGTGERMRAALKTSLGKIPGSRFIALGTRPADPDHWFARMLDGGADYAQSHAAAADDPPWRRRTWRKANPSLSHMPELEAEIAAEAASAKQDPALVPMFEALRLNRGTSDVTEAVLLTAGTWARIEAPDGEAPRGPYVLGLDLGSSAAMSAAAAYHLVGGALECFAVFPRDPDLDKRGRLDGVDGLYRDMNRRGELLIAGQFVSDVSALLREALRRWGRPVAIAADRYRDGELREALVAVDFPAAGLVFRGQGWRDGAEDVRRFQRAAADGHVRPRRSLLLRSALGAARLAVDVAGNAKLAKGSEGGRRARARDDAAAAAILAVAEGVRRNARPAPGWRYRGAA